MSYLIQNGYQKSGNNLLYRVLSDLLKYNDLYKTYSSETGIGEIIEDCLSEYCTFPGQGEIDAVRVYDGRPCLVVPCPSGIKKVSLSDDLFMGLSNFVWSHDLPSILLESSLRMIPKKIYLIRDGRDVVNSELHHMVRKHVLLLNPQFKYTSVEQLYSDLNVFERVVKRWAAHIRDYLDNAGEFMLVRYEELNSSKKNIMIKKLADFLCLKVSDSEVEKIVFETSIENSKKMIGEHVRSGKSGGWHEHFTNVHKGIFKKHAGECLIMMKYVEDMNW